MKEKLPIDDKAGVPWAVILTSLILASLSAWLVFMRHWQPWEAFAIVGLTALVIIVALLAVLMIWANPEDRAGLWRHIWQTCVDDLYLLLKYFRIRK